MNSKKNKVSVFPAAVQDKQHLDETMSVWDLLFMMEISLFPDFSKLKFSQFIIIK